MQCVCSFQMERCIALHTWRQQAIGVGWGARGGGGGCKKRSGNMGSVKIRTTRSIRLASHFLRAPNSLSGGCEFESLAQTITQQSKVIT
jgi:hypothetical protein